MGRPGCCGKEGTCAVFSLPAPCETPLLVCRQQRYRNLASTGAETHHTLALGHRRHARLTRAVGAGAAHGPARVHAGGLAGGLQQSVSWVGLQDRNSGAAKPAVGRVTTAAARHRWLGLGGQPQRIAHCPAVRPARHGRLVEGLTPRRSGHSRSQVDSGAL